VILAIPSGRWRAVKIVALASRIKRTHCGHLLVLNEKNFGFQHTVLRLPVWNFRMDFASMACRPRRSRRRVSQLRGTIFTRASEAFNARRLTSARAGVKSSSPAPEPRRHNTSSGFKRLMVFGDGNPQILAGPVHQLLRQRIAGAGGLKNHFGCDIVRNFPAQFKN